MSDFDREVSAVIAGLMSGTDRMEITHRSDEHMDRVYAEARRRIDAGIVHPPKVIYEVVRGSGIFSSAGWPKNDNDAPEDAPLPET